MPACKTQAEENGNAEEDENDGVVYDVQVIHSLIIFLQKNIPQRRRGHKEGFMNTGLLFLAAVHNYRVLL